MLNFLFYLARMKMIGVFMNLISSLLEVKKNVIITVHSFLIISISLSQTVVQMTRLNGVSVIPCKVNGLSLNFIYDTGASDVSISLVEAGFMLKNGYLTESDFIGSQNYSDANGDIEEGVTINLRSIIIGGLLIKDIQATIVKNTKAPLLLGQSALSKLGIVQQDFVKNTLTIYTNGAIPKAPLNNQAPSTATNKLEIVISGEDGTLTKFRIIQLNQIAIKPKPNIEYFWYNQEIYSLESTIGEWGGPLLNGQIYKYSSAGKLLESGIFVNGIRNGVFKEYRSTGVLDKITKYEMGKSVQIEERFNRVIYTIDGTPFQDGYKMVKTNPNVEFDNNIITTFYDGDNRIYRKETGYPETRVIEYFKNGKIRRQFTIYRLGTSMRKGEYRENYENGVTRVLGKYSDINYLPTGNWNIYHSDGTIKKVIKFTNDTIINGDTTFIGKVINDTYLGERRRIGNWDMVVANELEYDDKGNVIGKYSPIYMLNYAFWNPESVDNMMYPPYISDGYLLTDERGNPYRTDNEVIHRRRLDDYSIQNFYPHKFEDE